MVNTMVRSKKAGLHLYELNFVEGQQVGVREPNIALRPKMDAAIRGDRKHYMHLLKRVALYSNELSGTKRH